jgi:hypothetical protein
LAYEIGGALFFALVYVILDYRGVGNAARIALYPFLVFQAFLLLSYSVDALRGRWRR